MDKNVNLDRLTSMPFCVSHADMKQMRMRLQILAGALMLGAFTSPALARLGETAEECEARYGPPVEHQRARMPLSDPVAQVFTKNGITIIAEFYQGKVWSITFRRPEINHAEMEAILLANSSERTWSPPIKSGDTEYRILDDKSKLVVVLVDKDRKVKVEGLLLVSRDYTRAIRSEYVTTQARNAATGIKPAANVLPDF